MLEHPLPVDDQEDVLVHINKSQAGINEVLPALLQCDELINPETDSIYLSPLCSDDYKKIKTLGKGFDDELIAATQKHFFF